MNGDTDIDTEYRNIWVCGCTFDVPLNSGKFSNFATGKDDAAQTVLDMSDIPTGTAIITFSQTLGGALFVPVAQILFENKLVSGLKDLVPDLDPDQVLNTGATQLKSASTVINPAFLHGALEAYNEALMKCFQVAIGMACFSLVGAAFVEWKSVKGKEPGAVDA